MSALSQPLQRLDQNYPYIAIAAAIATVVGIALSSVILKVAAVALAAIALFGYIHENYFSSAHSSGQPAINTAPVIQHTTPSIKIITPLSTTALPNGTQEPTHITDPITSEEQIHKIITPPSTTTLPNGTQEPTHITDPITSEEQIHTLASINGISIQEIEKRARPEKHPDGPNQNIETGGWSFNGFLGMEESFKDVLLSDWKTVRALGWTHKDLAYHLAKMAEAAWAAEDSYDIDFNYLDREKPGQNLTTRYEVHRGRQQDIFSPEKNALDNGWGRQCLITNVSTGARVMWTPGVEDYIRKYGFYEGGGKQNKYRVDPIALISVLTGESEVSLRKKIDTVT